jgi:predicted transcriptional regulator
MAILKDSVLIPLNRQLFIPKTDNLSMDDLIIETDGEYRLFEKGDHIIVKNDDCCRSIRVTIKTKE